MGRRAAAGLCAGEQAPGVVVVTFSRRRFAIQIVRRDEFVESRILTRLQGAAVIGDGFGNPGGRFVGVYGCQINPKGPPELLTVTQRIRRALARIVQ